MSYTDILARVKRITRGTESDAIYSDAILASANRALKEFWFMFPANEQTGVFRSSAYDGLGMYFEVQSGSSYNKWIVPPLIGPIMLNYEDSNNVVTKTVPHISTIIAYEKGVATTTSPEVSNPSLQYGSGVSYARYLSRAWHYPRPFWFYRDSSGGTTIYVVSLKPTTDQNARVIYWPRLVAISGNEEHPVFSRFEDLIIAASALYIFEAQGDQRMVQIYSKRYAEVFNEERNTIHGQVGQMKIFTHQETLNLRGI